MVAPFIHEIQTPHIAIVPHGTLHFLPFHAFFDGRQYLIDRFEVSYAPSASILKYCLEKPEAAGRAPLLVGVAASLLVLGLACLAGAVATGAGVVSGDSAVVVGWSVPGLGFLFSGGALMAALQKHT